MEKSKEFLHYVASSIVSDQESIKIESRTDEMGVLLTLHVGKEDIGKVIGREGNTAKAIRTLLRVVGIKENARINLKIAEPEGSTHVRPTEKYQSVDEALTGKY